MEAPNVAEISGAVQSVDIGWFVMRFQQNDGTAVVGSEAFVHAFAQVAVSTSWAALCGMPADTLGLVQRFARRRSVL